MEAMLNSRLGRTILGATPVTIGCTSDNQVVLNESGVESRHAEIRPAGQGYSILDLGSGAGTFVNGQRLAPGVPQLLQNGDTIRIANSSLSYEMTSGPAVAPTIYAASPHLRSDQSAGEYPPTVVASGGSPISAANYGVAGQSGESPYAPPPPPVQSYSSAGAPPAYMSTNFSPNDPYSSAAPKKRGPRGLWIILGVIVGLLVVGGILLVFVLGRGPSTTPTQMYQAYCAALKAHNGQAAFNMYSSNAKQQLHLTQETITTIANATTDCTVGNVDNTTSAGSVTFTLTGVGKITEDDKLTSSEGNVWKIDGQQPRSTPTYTLFRFCSDLIAGDYNSAYGLYSSAYQSKTTEADYAKGFSSGKPVNCTLSNVDDTTGKGIAMITYPTASESVGYDEALINEKGSWKINSEQLHSTPAVTLNTFCTALKQKDYQTAYNQLSSDNQSSLTEADFQKNESTVTDCSVSNVDNNAGTGTIGYTTSDNKTATADYTLVQENGIWKLKTEKFH